MNDSVPAQPAKLLEAWAESLAQVLGQISGAPFPCAIAMEAPADVPPSAEGDLWMLCPYSGGLRGEMSLRIAPASVALLARIFLGEPAVPEAVAAAPASSEKSPSEKSSSGASVAAEVQAEYREAAGEFLRQVAGLVSSALKPQWGEVQLRPEPTAGPPSWPPSATAWLRAGESASGPVLELHLSAALVAALRTETNVAAAVGAAEASAPPASLPGAPPGTFPGTPEDQSRVKLDLLMDVELSLTLRFGTRSLPLAEILDLNPGAVIELDRHVEDPVDVLLDGRVVARGEVVVIEGCYGLRVTEVGPGSGP